MKLLGNKNEILQILFNNLMLGDAQKEKYVLEYFKDIVFDSKLELSQRQIDHIKRRLKEGNEDYIEALSFDMELLMEESAWYNLFIKEYSEGKKQIADSEDLPF